MQSETNIRQRGDIGGSAKKVGRRIQELERLYGVREGSLNEKGNNRIGEPNKSVDQITQLDLASKLGMSVDTLQNYKMLSEQDGFNYKSKTTIISESGLYSLIFESRLKYAKRFIWSKIRL